QRPACGRRHAFPPVRAIAYENRELRAAVDERDVLEAHVADVRLVSVADRPHDAIRRIIFYVREKRSARWKELAVRIVPADVLVLEPCRVGTIEIQRRERTHEVAVAQLVNHRRSSRCAHTL